MMTILFDLDGTLYDDRAYVKAGFRSASAYLRETHGIEAFGDMVWEYCVERNFETVFDRVLAAYDLPESELNRLVAEYHDSDPTLRPFPETETVLNELPDDCQTAVITGGKNGKKKLTLLRLNDAFDEVYVTPDHDTSKREATPFEAVLDTLDAVTEHTIFVGDNPELDFYWPNRLGLTTVWVRRRTTIFTSPEVPEIRPDYVLPDLSLVPEIAAKKAASDKTE